MKTELKYIKVRDIFDGYRDNGTNGIVGYGGKLNIRPEYQREFVYNEVQASAVVDSVIEGLPLGMTYWGTADDGRFEIIDGQQRTTSICRYIDGKFAYQKHFFKNYSEDVKNKILDYEMLVYVCDGTHEEKLKWFERINVAGETLTKQELRNAVYSGPWVTDAKQLFSVPGCNAQQIGKDLLRGIATRQEYLETAIKWHSNNNIDEYMAERQHDAEAKELWRYFERVISWVKENFTEYRREMKGIDWGLLYNEYSMLKLKPREIEKQVKKLMKDDEVEKKRGIYPYVLSGDIRHLNVRSFTEAQKREVFEKQCGVCPSCDKKFYFEDMEGDHITPWTEGGRTIVSNCQMLCRPCNRKKGAK